MSTEIMSQFLEGLHASRLLDNDRIDQLLRRPEPPLGDFEGTAHFLESNGWLTRFQIDEIRQGRGQALMFSGYRLLEKLPDQPSGRAFRAYHPALQQAVLLRWLNPEWLMPADDLRGYIERAQSASLIIHANAVCTLDAGIAGETPFLVQEYVNGADLDFMVREMGALPVPLACEYTRQSASALQIAHERGVFHGDISPARMLLTPVVRKTGVNGTGQIVTVRPAPGATSKLSDIGLIPRRPAASQIASAQVGLLGSIEYLAPERLTVPGHDVRSDLYSLGASLYYLLAAKPPIQGTSAADTLLQLQHAQPPRIESLRNDVSAPVAELIHRLLSKDPSGRPFSAGEVAQILQPYCTFGSTPVAPTPPIPMASQTISIANALPAIMAPLAEPTSGVELGHRPLLEPLPENTSDSQVVSPRTAEAIEFDERQDMFGDHQESDDETPPPRRRRQKSKAGWIWLILGICLHVTAVTLIVLYFTGVFNSTPSENGSSTPGTKHLKSPKKR